MKTQTTPFKTHLHPEIALRFRRFYPDHGDISSILRKLVLHHVQELEEKEKDGTLSTILQPLDEISQAN